MDRHWYESFFGEHALDVWQGSRSDELTAAEIDYLDGICPGEDLLDLACGDGRHAVGLAARRRRVTAIDIAEGNRARVEARAEAAGVDVDLIIGDITRLDQESAFDGAYLWGNSFGYFPRDATADFFASVARALRPGARFVIDTSMVAEILFADLGRRSWVRVGDDLRVLMESSYSPRESRLDTVYTTIRGDRVVDQRTAHVWVYTCGEVIAMAEAAGFEALDLHGDLEGSRFELGDDQLVLILIKT